MTMNPWQWVQMVPDAHAPNTSVQPMATTSSTYIDLDQDLSVKQGTSTSRMTDMNTMNSKLAETNPALNTSMCLNIAPSDTSSLTNTTLELPMLHDNEKASNTGNIPLPTPRLSQPVSIEVPMQLAPPRIDGSTNPYLDLPQHLHHYGLEAEAVEFARSHATCDFVLDAFLTMHKLPSLPAQSTLMNSALISQAGEELLQALEQSLRAREPTVHEQIARTAAYATPQTPHVLLPLSICLPWATSMRSLHMPTMPTHILAVSTWAQGLPDLGPGLLITAAPCTLIPIHWIVYVLQCTKLPVYRGASADASGNVPIVTLVVPFPQHWILIHRWLYTRDCMKLLAGLVPLRALIQQMHGTAADDLSASACIDALACVSLSVLLRLSLKIRATWHNGQAIGVIADSFWQTVSRAWDLVVSAMVLRKARAPRAAPASA